MKKLGLLIAMLIMVLPCASAAVMDSATSVFKTLHVNDGKGYAEFTMNNPSIDDLSRDKLSIKFNEVYGKVSDYKIEVWGECIRYNKINR